MKNIRGQFPIFKKRAKLAYFDNAATTQKPDVVLKAMDIFYREGNAPVHRSVYAIGEAATTSYEKVRDQVREFINATHREEIVFTAGTTASINAVVSGLSESFKAGDHIVLSDMDHHAMIVPWQAAALRKKLNVHFASLTPDGRIDLPAFKKLLTTHKPKFVGVTHVSNVLGTINPVREMIAVAHKVGAIVLLDAAQSAPHMPLDARALDCDFIVFSSHKMYGPTGVGVLYGKKELLERLPPFIFGGHMIETVSREKTMYAPLPAKFEGGTQPVAEVVGLGAAISFVKKIGFKAIQKHDRELSAYTLKALRTVPDLALLGPTTSKDRIPVFSFTIAGIHAHDIATLLDREGIAVRAGHHCAEVLHASLSLNASVRVSLGVYSTTAEIDALARALLKVQKKFYG